MVSGTQNLDKRAVSYISGSPDGMGDCERVKHLSYTHPPLLPVGSCGRFERAVNRTTHAPSAGTQVSASHTPTTLRTCNETPEPGPCVSPRCPTAGTSVGSLVSLVRFRGAWLALPNPSRWLLRTIRLGYAIQFARRPPKYRGIHFTTVRAADAPILRAEIAVLLAKDAIERVPPAYMRSGFYSPCFIVPKKGGGLRPILDLCVLNRALHRSVWTALRPLRTSTNKVVYAPVACHNSPATSSSGVRSI